MSIISNVEHWWSFLPIPDQMMCLFLNNAIRDKLSNHLYYVKSMFVRFYPLSVIPPFYAKWLSQNNHQTQKNFRRKNVKFKYWSSRDYNQLFFYYHHILGQLPRFVDYAVQNPVLFYAFTELEWNRYFKQCFGEIATDSIVINPQFRIVWDNISLPVTHYSFKPLLSKLLQRTGALTFSDKIVIEHPVLGAVLVLPVEVRCYAESLLNQKPSIVIRTEYNGNLLGVIDSNGVYFPLHKDDALFLFLQQLNYDVVQIAVLAGKKLQKCVFCNGNLKNSISQMLGYGKSCAKHFQLPYDIPNKRKIEGEQKMDKVIKWIKLSSG